MRKELKQAILNYIIENEKEFQIINSTVEHFRAYIYDKSGHYLIGGEDVHKFICDAVKLLAA